jgi:hypothetical protein
VELDLRGGSRWSLTQQGPEGITGATNYFLPVLARNGSDVEAARIWFLDSMDRGCGLAMFGW